MDKKEDKLIGRVAATDAAPSPSKFFGKFGQNLGQFGQIWVNLNKLA